MTIAFGAAGAIAYSAISGTSVSPSYPSGLTSNSALILLVGMKPGTVNTGTVTTPPGWLVLGSSLAAGGYGATLGADTGNTNLWMFFKPATGTETGSLAVTLANNNVAWAQIISVSGTATHFFVHSTFGSDVTFGNLSITGGEDVGLIAGDFVIGAFVDPTDVAAGAQFSAEAFSAPGISAWGSTVEVSEPFSPTGNDIGGLVIYSTVTTGTSTGPPTFTATASGTTTNVRGPGGIIRIRDVALPKAATLIDDFSVDRTATLWPASFNYSVTGGVGLLTDPGAVYSAFDAGTVGTATYYDLINSYFFAKMITPNTGTTPASEISMYGDNFGTGIQFFWTGGTLTMTNQFGYGSVDTDATLSVAAGSTIWCAFVEGTARATFDGVTGTAGNLYYFTSTNGISWTLQKTSTSPNWIFAARPVLGGHNGGGSSTATFDNVGTFAGSAISSSDTGSASDSQSYTVAVSSSDTISGNDNQSLTLSPVAKSSADTGSASDNQSYIVAMSNGDNASFTDNQSLTLSTVAKSSADVISFADAYSYANSTSDADVSSISDSQSVVTNALAKSDADTVQASDSQSQASSIASADSTTALDSQSYLTSVSSPETIGIADVGVVNNSIDLFSSDVVSVVDSQTVMPTSLIASADTMSVADGFASNPTISGSDTVSAVDNQTLTVLGGSTAVFSSDTISTSDAGEVRRSTPVKLYVSYVNLSPTVAPPLPDLPTYSKPEYNWMVGSYKGDNLYELPSIQDRTFSLSLRDFNTASFSINKKHPDRGLVSAGSMDLRIARNGEKILRNRIFKMSDKAGPSPTQFDTKDYREMLDLPFIVTNGDLVYNSPAEFILMDLIGRAMNVSGVYLDWPLHKGSVWPAQSTLPLAVTVKDRDKVWSAVQTFMGENDILINYDLGIDFYFGGKSAYKNVVLDYELSGGGSIADYSKVDDYSTVTNFLSVTGSVPDYDVNGNPFNYETTVAVKDLSTRPEGMWPGQVSDSSLTTKGLISTEAQYQILNAGYLRPTYDITLTAGFWQGRSHIDVGDIVDIQIDDGYVSVLEKQRVNKIDVKISQSGLETVQLNVGYPKDITAQLKQMSRMLLDFQKNAALLIAKFQASQKTG